MTELTSLFLLPAGLGLLGFVEPCSIGSSLLFIEYLEDKDVPRKVAETMLFAVTRALFIGLLGAGYAVIGVLYAAGQARALMISLGPIIKQLSGLRGSVGLGAFFGLNIPACAAPLLLALLGTAAAGGATRATLAGGFVSLAVFGLALSLPLVLAVLFAPARAALDWLAGLSRRVPLWTGVVLIALGLWSIGFGLFATLPKPA